MSLLVLTCCCEHAGGLGLCMCLVRLLETGKRHVQLLSLFFIILPVFHLVAFSQYVRAGCNFFQSASNFCLCHGARVTVNFTLGRECRCRYFVLFYPNLSNPCMFSTPSKGSSLSVNPLRWFRNLKMLEKCVWIPALRAGEQYHSNYSFCFLLWQCTKVLCSAKGCLWISWNLKGMWRTSAVFQCCCLNRQAFREHRSVIVFDNNLKALQRTIYFHTFNGDLVAVATFFLIIMQVLPKNKQKKLFLFSFCKITNVCSYDIPIFFKLMELVAGVASEGD